MTEPNTPTGIVKIGNEIVSFGLPVVTKEDLAQWALWGLKVAQTEGSVEEDWVRRKLTALVPVLLHEDVLMLTVKIEEAWPHHKEWQKLAAAMREHVEQV